MRRANPKKNTKQRITMTSAQVLKMKREATKEATDMAALLVLLATADELGLTEDQIARIAIRIDRYAGYVDSKIVELRALQDSIERQTGIRFKGW